MAVNNNSIELDVVRARCSHTLERDIEDPDQSANLDAALSKVKVSKVKVTVNGVQRTIKIKNKQQKHYENTPIQIYWEFLPPKNENFQMKNSGSFHISAQNIDCGYSLEPPHRGGSNEYPQSMFLSRNKKNKVYPCKPQFYYIKVGFKGVRII